MVASASLMNNFIGGLKTEFTGLNFPENAATDTENVVFSIIGEAVRREGIDLEVNAVKNAIMQSNVAFNTYKWTNVGGDGETQILVAQIGNTLYFFETSTATPTSPISAQLLASTVNISAFEATGNTSNTSITECQFTDGNGYLFVFHPACDSFYCTYNAGTITANKITIQIRDFAGIVETGISVNLRPSILTPEHNYNLVNQGWVSGNPWQAFINVGGVFHASIDTETFPTSSGLVGVSGGQVVYINVYPWFAPTYAPAATGFVTGYTGTGLSVATNYIASGIAGDVFQVTATATFGGPNVPCSQIFIYSVAEGFINSWVAVQGNYPSNADIWYEYKDSTGVFDPSASSVANVSVGSGQSPQGHFIYNAFDQDRGLASGITSLTAVSTNVRPKCGTWFQGRVWYSGVDASQQATGDAIYNTWTENIYFSQIVQTPQDFGNCYQVNDPTDEILNEELPTDGGVIVIQGCGSIYNLFPIQNGLLVFAANGIWIIRGNEGLGFTANDYSINKISSVQSISCTSLISVNGLPMFWNEEGIYAVTPSKGESPYGFGGLQVEPLTVGTILTYYQSIPRDSKLYVRGDYNPITYIAQWAFRSTQESGIANRYQFDTILNLNIYNRAFYPYTIASDSVYYVSDVIYTSYPSGTLDATYKYFATDGTNVSFAEELDDVNWVDWFSVDGVGVDYTSYFVTGYNLHGKGLKKWNSNYIQMFCNNDVPYAYTIQGIWDYANSGNSGRYSTIQTVTNFNPNYNRAYRRHKLRGQGMSLQIAVSSVQGQPFSFDGWSQFEDIRQGP
jgi:hypothetical protein